MNDRLSNGNNPSEAAIVRVLQALVELVDDYVAITNSSVRELDWAVADQIEKFGLRLVELGRKAKMSSDSTS